MMSAQPVTESVYTIPLHGRGGVVKAWAIVDGADFAWLRQTRWHLTSEGYACFRGRDGDRRISVYMHREILGLSRGSTLHVDHINGDRLDNRRQNLRRVTRSQQQQNLPKRRGMTSRYRNVHWSKSAQKWAVQIRVGGRVHHLGHFESEDDAGAVATAARKTLHPHAVEERCSLDLPELDPMVALDLPETTRARRLPVQGETTRSKRGA